MKKYKNSKNNIVSAAKKDIQAINLTEQETIQTLYLLQEDGYINIKEKSVHDDLSRYWNVALKSSLLHYFENIKAAKTDKRNTWIQFWIPVALSTSCSYNFNYSSNIKAIIERINQLMK